MPARVVFAECDAERHMRVVGNSQAHRSASRSFTLPSRTMVVSQLKENRMASAQVAPKASPGALPIPSSASEVESASAFAVDKEGKPVKRPGDFGNIQASYRFECGGRPENIKIKLFEQLPDLLGLKLQLTTDKGERSVDLAPGTPDLAL